MANHKSAEKRIRQTETRTARNRANSSALKTAIKKVESALATGDKAAASAAMKLAEPALARSVNKGVLHKNTAARKISRLTKRVRALA